MLEWFWSLSLFAQVVVLVGLSLVLISMTMVLGLTAWMFPKEDHEAAVQKAKALAVSICSAPQFVTQINPWAGSLALDLRSSSDGIEETRPVFPKSHPDFPTMETLGRLQVIQFEFCDEPAKGVTSVDAAAYLRLYHKK